MAKYESGNSEWDSEAFSLDLPKWGGPSADLKEALSLIQRDINASDLPHHEMQFVVTGGTSEWPEVNLKWQNGGTAESIDPTLVLPFSAVELARQIAQGLIESEGIYWPTCALHESRVRASVDRDDRPVWICDRSGHIVHLVAPLGMLDTVDTGKRRRWLTLEQLARPSSK